MTERPIKMESIIKRQLYQQDLRHNDRFLEQMYETACDSILVNSSMAKMYTRDLFEACMNKDAANQAYINCLTLIGMLESAGDTNFSNELQHTFIEEILPYIDRENLVNIDMTAINYGCPNTMRGALKEASIDYKVADRILNNHAKLCKRFDIVKYMDEHRHCDTDDITYDICEMVDTYDMPVYGKFNTIIEEMSFLWARLQKPEPFSAVIESAVNYFIFTRANEEGFSKDLEKIGRVLDENCCITHDDVYPSYYICESEDFADSNDVRDLIKKFNTDEKKTETGFRRVMNKLYSKNPKQIIDESPNILSWIRPIVIFGVFVVNLPAGCIVALVDKFIQMEVTRKQADKMLKIFQSEKKKIEKKIDSTNNDKTRENLEKYNNSLEKCVDKLEEYRDSLYSEKELEKRREEEYGEDNPESSDDDFGFGDDGEFDIDLEAVYIKMERAPERMREFSYVVENCRKILSRRINMPTTGARDYLTGDPYDYLNESDRLEACIEEYYIPSNMTMGEVNNIMETAINDIRSTGIKNIRYNIFESVVSVDITDTVVFTDVNEELKEHAMSDSVLGRLSAINDIESTLQFMGYANEQAPILTKDAINAIPKLNKESVYTFMELAAMIGAFPDNTASNILKEFKLYNLETLDENAAAVQNGILEYCYTTGVANKIDGISESTDQSTMLEMAQNILQEKVDLNAVKLAMANLKKKTKDLSAKEQEFSRNLDVAVNGFATATKNALVSNRREAIIKGSVIPSFSRCIKIGIAAGATGLILGPLTAVLGCLGALAVSKHLTKRERQIILDEIDTELKVVDKELDQLDHNPKKMRALLTYKKKLQRERQRIAYNLKVSGQVVPDAAVGGKDYDPD